MTARTAQKTPAERAAALILVTVQRVAGAEGAPSDVAFTDWVNAASDAVRGDSELSIRIVNEDESRKLNARYRRQDRPTNVLSFPAEMDAPVLQLLQERGDPAPLGDLVICAPLVAREAEEQGKRPLDHWAHLVIHGVLHLQGFDHVEDGDAEKMETLEREIMADLGLPDPYRPR
jgi:probable rRNA maturation factor